MVTSGVKVINDSKQYMDNNRIPLNDLGYVGDNMANESIYIRHTEDNLHGD